LNLPRDNALTPKCRIVKYGLEEDVVLLRKAGYSIKQIVNELNNSGKVPADDPITIETVNYFLTNLPRVQKEIVRHHKQRMINTVNINFDIIYELTSLFERTKNLMDAMEKRAEEQGKLISAKAFKDLSSEMREMLRHMMDIQKEINDYENVRKFMEIVIQVLQEECPEKIPIIAERLRLTKGTQWFSSMMGE